MELGYIEGEKCNRHGCNGIMKEHPVENCCCHINSPCSACTKERGYCPECGIEVIDEIQTTINDYICLVDRKTQKIWKYEPRPLDPTKIDYRIKSHTDFTQICEGVYPEGTTEEEVRKRVNGTFGGRFEYFRNGKFKFIAYTD